MNAPAHTRELPVTSWRQAYVVRQLSTARSALADRSIAAARAALRVLSSEDFALPQEASRYLRVLRGREAEELELFDALRRLCALSPAG